MAIAEHESFAKSASIAYEHMYETNDDFVNPFAVPTVAATVKAPTPDSSIKEYRIIRADSATHYDLILFAPNGDVVMSGDFGCELEMVTLRDTLNEQTSELRQQLAAERAKNAALEAQVTRKTELLKRIYDLPQIKDIAISILIEDELDIYAPENSPKFAKHFEALQAPADAVTHIPCKTCNDKLIIWQWGIDTGYAHICPDCTDDYSIEQLEARKYKNVSKFYQYTCNICKGEGKTWEKFLHGGAGEIVCRKCDGKGKIEEEIKSLTETELVHNHKIDKLIEKKRQELGIS
jgi:hypothetical protein